MTPEEELVKLRKAIEDNGYVFKDFAYSCWCSINIPNSSITAEMIDDLFTSFISGIVYNIGYGRTPMVMEGTGPPSDADMDEQWLKLFYELANVVALENPIDSWSNKYKDQLDWVTFIKKSLLQDKVLKTDPNEFFLDLRKRLVPKHQKK